MSNLINLTSNFLQSQDLFGHPIALNYNKRSTYNSSLGGFISILLKLLIMGFTIHKGKIMLTNKDDEIKQSEQVMNFEELGELSFKDAGFKFYINVANYPIYSRTKESIEEMNRYINIEFVQNDQNFNVMHRYSLQQCSQNFFEGFENYIRDRM